MTEILTLSYPLKWLAQHPDGSSFTTDTRILADLSLCSEVTWAVDNSIDKQKRAKIVGALLNNYLNGGTCSLEE